MAKGIWFACKKTPDCYGHTHSSQSVILLDAIEKSKIEVQPLQSTNFMHSNSCQPLMYIPMAKAIWFACNLVCTQENGRFSWAHPFFTLCDHA